MAAALGEEDLLEVMAEITTVLASEASEHDSVLAIGDKFEEKQRCFQAQEEKVKERVRGIVRQFCFGGESSFIVVVVMEEDPPPPHP